MASRDDKDLSFDLRVKWMTFHNEMDNYGYQAILTCTHRSNEEQAELYAKGRTRPGRIVTWARPGQSRHNRLPAEAFDIAIIENGKLNWNPKSKAWITAKQIGKKIGLVQLRREACHFQKP